MTLVSISPPEARRLIEAGARLIDIRGADEHARERIPGAENRPLDRLGPIPGQGPVIYHCRSGMRTSGNAAALAAAAPGDCYMLEGGIDAWRKAGLEVAVDRGQPIEIMRQVQMTAGALIVLGVVLGFLAGPAFFGLSAFVGCGLFVAGATGWCGLARLLATMPWNRRAAAG